MSDEFPPVYPDSPLNGGGFGGFAPGGFDPFAFDIESDSFPDPTRPPADPEPAPPLPTPNPLAAMPPTLSPDSPRDDRLIARAIAGGWSIPSQYVEPLIRRQIEIATSTKSKHRDATRSFSALVAASRAEHAAIMLQINANLAAQKAAAAGGDSPIPAQMIDPQSGAVPQVPRVILYLPDNGRDPA